MRESIGEVGVCKYARILDRIPAPGLTLQSSAASFGPLDNSDAVQATARVCMSMGITANISALNDFELLPPRR